MEKTVCLCWMALFNSLPNDGEVCHLSRGMKIIKSVQDDTEYYDIVDGLGELYGCDGEIYHIIESDECFVTLLSEDSECDDAYFTISQEELRLAL